MDTSQEKPLSTLSTNGIRGHKRPRYPKKHLITCNDSSTDPTSIQCECDKFEQEQNRINGKLNKLQRVRFENLV